MLSGFLSQFPYKEETITVWREDTWFYAAVGNGDGADGTRGAATFRAGSRTAAVKAAVDYVCELEEKKEAEEEAILFLGNIERLWAAASEEEEGNSDE